MAKRLIALVPILFENKQYEPGEPLPTSNSSYVSAWERGGSAVWKGDEEQAEAKTKKPKARSKTAKAGVEGIAQPATGAEPDLVGTVPSAQARGIVPEITKKAPKSQS